MATALAWALAPHPSHNSVFSVSVVLVRACGSESRDGFNGCFLMINDVEQFSIFIGCLNFLFWEMPVQIFCPFFCGLSALSY